MKVFSGKLAAAKRNQKERMGGSYYSSVRLRRVGAANGDQVLPRLQLVDRDDQPALVVNLGPNPLEGGCATARKGRVCKVWCGQRRLEILMVGGERDSKETDQLRCSSSTPTGKIDRSLHL